MVAIWTNLNRLLHYEKKFGIFKRVSEPVRNYSLELCLEKNEFLKFHKSYYKLKSSLWTCQNWLGIEYFKVFSAVSDRLLLRAKISKLTVFFMIFLRICIRFRANFCFLKLKLGLPQFAVRLVLKWELAMEHIRHISFTGLKLSEICRKRQFSLNFEYSTYQTKLKTSNASQQLLFFLPSRHATLWVGTY